MRRLPPVEIFIVLLTAVMLYLGWRIYGFKPGYAPAIKAQKAPSELYARLTIRYDKPPIYEEEYRMQDVEGISAFQYRIRSYNCKEITIKAPSGPMHDVSFFFGGLDQDGVWQLVNKAPRPHADAYYTVYVKQLADYQQGERTITFTDPHYWAVTPGRQYSLDLSKQKPNDFVYMQSKPDPAYEKIVDDFRQFGPDEFQKNVAAAQARARGSSCPQ